MAQPHCFSKSALRLVLFILLFEASLVAQRTIHPVNRVTTVIDDRFTVLRPADRHSLARAEFDAGPASPDTPMERMVLVLSPDPDQQIALDELLDAQQNPESPDYHRWLTPEEFGNQFGVSDNDISQIVSWLQRHGFTAEPVSPARRSIVFSGTAAQVASAFHTEIHVYNVNGQKHFANARAPEIPEALDAVVNGIASLHDFRSKPMLGAVAPAAAGPSGIRPEYNASRTTHYLSPADFTAIYDVGPLYASSTDGTGQSIAVAGRSNINLADVQGFRSTFGLPAKDPTIIVNGTNPGVSADQSEQFEATLDVEWAGVAAQKAAVQFVVSASTNTSDGVDLSVQYIVNHNLAPVVTLSFGSCESAMGTSWNQHWNGLWQQAAAQGMSAMVASGDSGAAGCDGGSSSTATGGQSVNGLCSSPFSTCVGGTQFNDTANPSAYWSGSNASNWGSALSYIPEVVWNQSSASGGSGLWASGGGSSMVYPKPSWQTGPGVPSDGRRDVPDVSLNASSHDAQIVDMNGGLYLVSGTSVAAPSFASVVALAVQKAGARLGNINPALYTLASKQATGGAAVFHDVTTGNNSVPGLTGYSAGVGYDRATGLGSVDAAIMVNHWSDASVQVPSFQLSASPTSVTVSKSASGTSALTLSLSGGFNSAVALSAGGLPAGVTAAFSPVTIPAGSAASTLTLNAGAQAAAGSTAVTVTASGGGVTRTTPLTLVIPACTYSISPTSAIPGASAGTYTVQVTAGAGCSWTAVSGVTWVTVTSGASGSGNGTVNYSLAANSATTTRSGAITIAGISFGVTQAAAAPPFSLNPLSANALAAASTGSVAVSATSSTTSWTAVSNVSWMTITTGASNTGSKTVSYSVAANTATASRTGTLTIAGLTFPVVQAATPCTYAINPASANPGAAAGTYTVLVTAGSGCSWTAVSGVTWVTVTSGASGSGNGTVNYSLAANTATSTRSGAIAIAGLSHSVTQAAAVPPFSLNAPSANVGAAASTGTVAVSAASSTASWTAVSNVSWITIASGASSTGSKSVGYSVAANTTTASRTGTLTIAGLTFPVVQAGAAGFTLSSTPSSVALRAGSSATTSISVAGTGGFTGSVSLTASGLPAGVTGVFAPAAIAAGGTAVLTLTAAASAAAATSNLTVSGTSGNLSATAPVSLTVSANAAAAFTLKAASSSLTLAGGSSASTTVSVVSAGGFTGNVTLAATGLPCQVTAVFTPATVPAGGTASLVLTSNYGSLVVTSLTISGSSGSLSATAPLSLTVTDPPGFKLLANPSFLSLPPGSKATTTITMQPTGGYTGTATLEPTILPPGITATVSPSTVGPGGTATLTLTASANAPPVPSWVYLAGLLPDRSNMGQAVITLNNPQPGFILSPVNLPAAQQTLTGYLDAIVGLNLSGGFSGDIKFTFSGLPAGVIGSFSGPLECGGPTCRLVFFELVAGVTAVATPRAPITITGTSGNLTSSTTFTIAVAPTTNFWVDPPVEALGQSFQLSTPVGGTAAVTLLGIGKGKGFTVGVTGVPPTATTSIVAAPPSAYAVSIATTNQTPPGCYPLNFTGNVPGQQPVPGVFPLFLTVTK
jgi:hypothetical protein